MAVAIQPAMPRSIVATPIAIVAANKPHSAGKNFAKDTLVHFKPAGTGNVSNVRSRRERPCDACRRRKSRCVINEGALLCVLCEFHKQDCTFVQDPQPRKRKIVVSDDKKEVTPKKRYVDLMHMSESTDISVLPSPLPPSTNHETMLISAARSVDLVSSTHKNLPSKGLSKPTTSPTHRPINTHIQHNVLGETLGLQSHSHSRYIGLTTPFDTTLISLSKFDSRNESILSLGTLRRVNDHETFMMVADENVSSISDDAEALDAIDNVVSPHGPALIELYFRIVHPSFPIIQKRVFLERVRSGDLNFAPSLLAGIYILALNWWAQDASLAGKAKPDVVPLEAIAQRTLMAAMQRPKLSTVQAGLLLLQRPEADSWSLTTQLVAIGQELGLHLDCSSWSVPLWERELRKKIAWALYMQDKWSSLIHGRPSHIFAANWAVRPMSLDGSVLEDDLRISSNSAVETEETRAELEKGLSLFSQMISLTSIMAEIMDTFYTQVAIADFAAAGKNSTRLILDRAKPVQIKLKDWYARLPATVRMESLTPGQLSSTGMY